MRRGRIWYSILASEPMFLIWLRSGTLLDANGAPLMQDTSNYHCLWQAYESLQASYRAQRASYEANQLRWMMERQELRAAESNSSDALEAVKEALRAETEAHDTDLRSLGAVMEYSRRLQDEHTAAVVSLDEAEARIREMQQQGKAGAEGQHLTSRPPEPHARFESRVEVFEVENRSSGNAEYLHGLRPLLILPAASHSAPLRFGATTPPQHCGVTRVATRTLRRASEAVAQEAQGRLVRVCHSGRQVQGAQGRASARSGGPPAVRR